MSRSFHDKVGQVFVYSTVSFRPFPSVVSMLWNLWRDPTPLGSPRPTKTKGWTMWRANRHRINILWHGNIAARARIRSTSLFTSWNCQSDLCRVISLLHDSSGTISIDWLLSLRSKEHCPPTSDLNEQHTSILLCSRKSVTEERLSMKYI